MTGLVCGWSGERSDASESEALPNAEITGTDLTEAILAEAMVDFGSNRSTTVRAVGAEVSTPNGIRTRVSALKGRCPRPLDDGGIEVRSSEARYQPVIQRSTAAAMPEGARAPEFRPIEAPREVPPTGLLEARPRHPGQAEAARPSSRRPARFR
jgi:hypothetical protein